MAAHDGEDDQRQKVEPQDAELDHVHGLEACLSLLALRTRALTRKETDAPSLTVSETPVEDADFGFAGAPRGPNTATNS